MCMRIHITLDEPLVAQIDELAGKRGRSAFIRDAVAYEVDRQQRWAAFEEAFGSIPDIGERMNGKTIAEDRLRETEANDRKLRAMGLDIPR